MRQVMTPEQVADYLQLTTDTIYRLIRQNKLGASQIGRTYRIPKEDLDTFLLTHSNRSLVRKELFARVKSIAERNPVVDSDELLDELERMDEERKLSAKRQDGE